MLAWFLKRLEVMLEQFHFAQRHQVGERRFSALIQVDAVGMQTIATTAGGGIVERKAQIVATEEPLEREPGLLVPFGVVGRAISFEAGGNGGVGLNRLLVELGRLPATGKKSIGADRAKMAVRRF